MLYCIAIIYSYIEIQVSEYLDKTTTKKIVMKKQFRLRPGLEQTLLNITHGE